MQVFSTNKLEGEKMDLQNIQDQLNTEFSKEDTRMIFWFDDKGEYEDEVSELQLGDVRLYIYDICRSETIGIRRIISAAGEYGLSVPTVEVFDDMFRVNLCRNVQNNMNGGENSGVNGGENFGDNFGVNGGDNSGDKPYIRKNEQKLTNTQQKILDCVAEDKYISAKKIAEIIGMSGRSIENNIKKMKEIGILVRKGSPKSGYWEIID